MEEINITIDAETVAYRCKFHNITPEQLKEAISQYIDDSWTSDDLDNYILEFDFE